MVSSEAFWDAFGAAVDGRQTIIFAGAGCSLEAGARRSTKVSLDVLRNYVQLGQKSNRADHVVARYGLLQRLTLQNPPDPPADCRQVLEDIARLEDLEDRSARSDDKMTPAERAELKRAQPDLEAFLKLSQVTEFVANDQYLLGDDPELSRTTLLELMEVQECPEKPTDFHRAVAFLMREGLVSEVITTNYDCLFEIACKKHSIDCKVAHDAETYDMSCPPRIIKLHGSSEDCSHPQNLMVTASDVCRWHHRWAEAVLQDHLRQGCVVLFVGFSGRDLNVISTLNEIAETLPRVGRDRCFLVSFRGLSFIWYQLMAKAHVSFEKHQEKYVLAGLPGRTVKATSIAGRLYVTLLGNRVLPRLTELVASARKRAEQAQNVAVSVARDVAAGLDGPGATDLAQSVLFDGVVRRLSVADSSLPSRNPLQDVLGAQFTPSGEPPYKSYSELEPELEAYAYALSLLEIRIRQVDAVPQVTHPVVGFPILEVREADGKSRSYLLVPVHNFVNEASLVIGQAGEALESIEHSRQTAECVLILCTSPVLAEEDIEKTLGVKTKARVIIAHPSRLWRDAACLL